MIRFLLPALILLVSCADNRPKKTESGSAKPQPKLQLLEAVQPQHIRGLFMVNDQIAWASGAGGTFMKTVNGEDWTSDTIAGYTHLDFRDVHAFDELNALVMAAGNEGRILRTENGGHNWTEVYTRLDSGIFLDGMDFYGQLGYCYGDPINGKMVLVRSIDQGRTWQEVDSALLPKMLEKEAGFAASGTGIIVSEKQVFVATGGDSVARVVVKNLSGWQVANTPMRCETGCGIFSAALVPPSTLITVGGCYLDSITSDGNCAISNDLGITWNLVSDNPPRGYRSCVAYSQASGMLLTCGRTGVDASFDSGNSWQAVSNEGFYTCAMGDSIGWLLGRGGKMAKLSW